MVVAMDRSVLLKGAVGHTPASLVLAGVVVEGHCPCGGGRGVLLAYCGPSLSLASWEW